MAVSIFSRKEAQSSNQSFSLNYRLLSQVLSFTFTYIKKFFLLSLDIHSPKQRCWILKEWPDRFLMNEWLAPGLLHVYTQEKRSSASTEQHLSNISFLLASGNFPAKAVTTANYAYISVACINLWLPVSDYSSSSYKVHTTECGLYFPFDTYQNTWQTPGKRKNIKLSQRRKLMMIWVSVASAYFNTDTLSIYGLIIFFQLALLHQV